MYIKKNGDNLNIALKKQKWILEKIKNEMMKGQKKK